MKNNIGLFIKQKRKEYGYTQEDFAINIGVDKKVAIKLIEHFFQKWETFISMINESFLSSLIKEKSMDFINRKIEIWVKNIASKNACFFNAKKALFTLNRALFSF